jgi:hypothetical protein
VVKVRYFETIATAKISPSWSSGTVHTIRLKIRGFKHGRGLCLRAINIRSTTSFGGEVKPEGPCLKIFWHVKYLFEYEIYRLFRRQKSTTHNIPPASLLDVSAGNLQRALVDESGMIRN